MAWVVIKRGITNRETETGNKEPQVHHIVIEGGGKTWNGISNGTNLILQQMMEGKKVPIRLLTSSSVLSR